ncbi:MAG TPA: methyltransferase domain-containing protein, partial [Pyrinomonadaceae bacterium]|nr:methyltransferase domain-containing protein [Pyrinomonadaceae bacterium]
PGYPAEVLQLFSDKMNLTKASVMADIGSGPGISARLFVENGNVVFGVEPNDAMRAAAEEVFRDLGNFHSMKGDSENTTLPNASVDFVISAQAFHWFEPKPTRAEFRRILKQGGHVALMWNLRQLDTTPFLREYEQFILENANDYEAVRHDNITEAEIAEFFNNDFEHAVFDNVQVFDFEGLKGRLFSSSYMPAEDTEQGREIEKGLFTLFTKYAQDGKIKVFYDTNIFYSKW